MSEQVQRLAAPEGILLALLDLSSVNETALLAKLELTADEQQRLATLKNPSRRRDWLAGRWLARQLLTELSAKPFTITAGNSKPLVQSDTPLFCNWSHSGSWLLAAATTLGPVGCDIERVKKRQRLDSLIEKTFAASEAESLLAMNEAERQVAFFQLWTLKEAALKADGIGIAEGLKKPVCHWGNGWQLRVGGVQINRQSLTLNQKQFEAAIAYSAR